MEDYEGINAKEVDTFGITKKGVDIFGMIESKKQTCMEEDTCGRVRKQEVGYNDVFQRITTT